jgi:hypothetical protein
MVVVTRKVGRALTAAPELAMSRKSIVLQLETSERARGRSALNVEASF